MVSQSKRAEKWRLDDCRLSFSGLITLSIIRSGQIWDIVDSSGLTAKINLHFLPMTDVRTGHQMELYGKTKDIFNLFLDRRKC